MRIAPFAAMLLAGAAHAETTRIDGWTYVHSNDVLIAFPNFAEHIVSMSCFTDEPLDARRLHFRGSDGDWRVMNLRRDCGRLSIPMR